MLTLDETRPVWVEINLDNLAHNIKEVRKNTREDAMVTAVVKANGYGHGSVEISRTFLENGADRLAVAILTEAIELRKANITEPILVLGYTPPTQYNKVIEYDLIQTIYNHEEAKILSKLAKEENKTVTIHLKVDSGMGRIGFLPTEESIQDIIKISNLPNIFVEGIYTHFAKADERDKAHVNGQFSKYTKLVNALQEKGLNIPIKHVSNSASIIDLPEFNEDMVRAGIMIYGYYPSDEVNKEDIKLKPAMTLKAKISNLKTVDKGTGISYGQVFVTDKRSKIGTIPIGYADGFTRLLTGKAEVYIKGKRVNVVGKICMDQCMIDLTDIEGVKVGDEVVIFGYENELYPHVDELAKKIDTINYEIICMMGRRIPRAYMKNNEIIKITDYLLD